MTLENLTEMLKGVLEGCVLEIISHEKIYGYNFDGTRHDTGDKLGFLKATVDFDLKREDLGGPLRAWLKTLDL